MKQILGSALAAVLLLVSRVTGRQRSGGDTTSTADTGAGESRGRADPTHARGKPDMQGNWTNQTFTPLERPAQYKDKQFFTAEEAKPSPGVRSRTSRTCRGAKR